MNWLRRLQHRLIALTWRGKLEDDLEAELAAHLALKQQRMEQDGVPPGEAARQARIALGSRAAWKEEIREAWTFGWVERVWRDVRFGIRILDRNRTFTLLVLLTLTLGIGANTAVFALINGLLFRTLPVRQPEELIRIAVTNLPPAGRYWVSGRSTVVKERRSLSYPLYEALNARKDLFSGMFGVAGNGSVVMEARGAPHRVFASKVSGSYFPVLGVEPLAGRLLSEHDDVPGGPSTGWAAVISEPLWRRLFGGRADAIGAKIIVERVPFTIAGVAPPGFFGVHPGVEIDVWLPLSAMEAMYPSFRWRDNRGSWMIQAMARRPAGVTLQQTSEQLRIHSRTLLEEVAEPGLDSGTRQHFLAMRLEPRQAGSGDSWVVTTYIKALWILMAAVGAVLLIAATNLTNLMLARSTARRQEMAVRLALGASAGVIRRQLMIESGLLAFTGTVCGVIFAGWIAEALQKGISSSQLAVRVDTRLDLYVLAFLSIVLILVTAISGLAPAWSASRAGLNEAMKVRSSGRTTSRFRGSLIVAQTALSMTLLGAAGLMLVSLRGLLGESTGFEARQTVLLTPDLFNAGIERPDQARAYQNLAEQTRRQPNVAAAAWTMIPPLTGGLSSVTAEIPGHADLTPNERMLFRHQVSGQYFAAMGIPILAGRDFPLDPPERRAMCILSENAARRFFGSPDEAIGRRIKPYRLDWLEVIAVAGDSKYQHIREPRPLTLYTPYWLETPNPGMTLAVRHSGPREPVVNAIQALFQKEAGRLPFTRVTSVEENRGESVRTEKLLAFLLGGLAAFALLISATGIAGLLAYEVARRRKEIGIRLALGARPAQVRGQLQRHGLKLAAAGLILGGAVCYTARGVIDSFLYRTDSTDPAVWTAVIVLLLATALAATALPAWRAARIDPMESLRVD